MYQSGQVLSSDKDYVYIMVNRQSACGDKCSSCSGSCKDSVLIKADNTVDVQCGDLVKIESNSSSVYKAAFLLYIVPLIVVIIGILISKKLFPVEYVSALSDLIALTIGLVLYLLSMYIIHLYCKNKSISYKITKKKLH